MSTARIALWVVTLSCIGLVVRSVLLEPVPGYVSLVALGLLALIYAVGHAFPRLEMFGAVLSRGSSRRAEVALCFVAREGLVDLGPILQILKAEDTTAAFFFSSAALEVVKLDSVIAQGHVVGLTSSDRGVLTWLTAPAIRHELKNGAALLRQRFEHRSTLFVPPTRGFGAALFATARRLGVRAVLPRRYSAEEDVPNGALIEISLDEPRAAEACAQVLETLKAKKLRAVALSHLQ